MGLISDGSGSICISAGHRDFGVLAMPERAHGRSGPAGPPLTEQRAGTGQQRPQEARRRPQEAPEWPSERQNSPEVLKARLTPTNGLRAAQAGPATPGRGLFAPAR